MVVRSFGNIIYISTALILFFIGIHRLLFSSPGAVEQFTASLMYPFLIIENYITKPLQSWRSAKSSRENYQALIDFYVKENEALQAQLIEFQSLKNYIEKTKELVEFAQKYKTDKSVLAQILLKNFDDSHQFILLDAGLNRGIERDMVLVHKNCLLGRITEVYQSYSKAVLITDRLCKVGAYCSSNGVQGIHVGSNSLDFTELTFVNHLETLVQHDLVLSSGDGIVFPRGFGLGYIKEFIPDGLNYQVTLEPLLDFEQLEYCYIIQKGAKLDMPETSEQIIPPSSPLNIAAKLSNQSNNNNQAKSQVKSQVKPPETSLPEPKQQEPEIKPPISSDTIAN